MPPSTIDRDRWVALGLLVAALALAYFVLLHPWWTVPMLGVESRIDDLQQRELRVRTQLQQAPEHVGREMEPQPLRNVQEQVLPEERRRQVQHDDEEHSAQHDIQ